MSGVGAPAPEQRDSEELYHQHPVRAVPLGPPSEAQLELIRAHVVDPSIMDEREPFVWQAMASNDREDASKNVLPALASQHVIDRRDVDTECGRDGLPLVPFRSKTPDLTDFLFSQFGVVAALASLEQFPLVDGWVSESPLDRGVFHVPGVRSQEQMPSALVFDTLHRVGADFVIANAGGAVTDVADIKAFGCGRSSGDLPGNTVRQYRPAATASTPDLTIAVGVETGSPEPARLGAFGDSDLRPEALSDWLAGILTGHRTSPRSVSRPRMFAASRGFRVARIIPAIRRAA